ncbi:hypothetical protein TcWFU_001789 [Taenia crassiceps]|uniref:DUF5734 domain-containing protein n=1 Tax=Taenia crassiceps TaxID=6207 RepID=A0ABR4QP14_9CEST
MPCLVCTHNAVIHWHNWKASFVKPIISTSNEAAVLAPPVCLPLATLATSHTRACIHGSMDKSVGSTKRNKEVQIRTPLLFLEHTKLKKHQQLEAILERESSYPHASTTTTYVGKIFNNRIEFAAEKNAKKPPVKKIKFSQVERIIPNDDAFCVHVGWRQGKSASVTSFAFTEENVYNGFINNLEKTRGFVVDSKNRTNQSSRTETFQRRSDSSPSLEWENLGQAVAASEPVVHGRLASGYTTSYIVWEEPEAGTHHDLMSTDLHMPNNEAPSTFATSEVGDKVDIVQQGEEGQTVTGESMDEAHHCPCCVQRSGINLNLSNHHRKAYAPLSEKGQSYANFPVHLSRSYKCYRPHQSWTMSSLTRGSSSYYNESMLETLDDSESTLMHQPTSRPRSLPSPVRCLQNVAKPVVPRQKNQLTRHQQKITPKTTHSHQRTWTVYSSSSSGYTSSTFHEDGLELIVDPTTSGQYIRNQKRFVTGKVRSKTKNEPIYHYRRTSSSLPRIPRVRDYD